MCVYAAICANQNCAIEVAGLLQPRSKTNAEHAFTSLERLPLFGKFNVGGTDLP